MLEVLASLEKLQVVDKEMFDLNELSKEIPLKLSDLDDKLSAQQKVVFDLEATVKAVKLAMKEKELGLQDKEATITKYNGQLSQLKTNKEYTAMQSEISRMKADISLIEEEMIDALDKVKDAEEKVNKEKEVLKTIEDERTSKKSELDEEFKHNADRIDELKKQHDDFAVGVDEITLRLYTKILEGSGGVALAPVKGDVCGACYVMILAQELNDVLIGKKLVTCQNCHRILYSEKKLGE